MRAPSTSSADAPALDLWARRLKEPLPYNASPAVESVLENAPSPSTREATRRASTRETGVVFAKFTCWRRHQKARCTCPKDTGTQSKASNAVQKGSTPTREVPVTRSNEGLAISNGKLMRRKRKAKIGLWEGRNRSTKKAGKVISNIGGDSNGKEGSFMVINRKSSGQLELMQDVFSC